MRDKQPVSTQACFCLNTLDPGMEHSPISNDPFAALRQRFLARCADQLAALKATRERSAAPGTSGDALARIAHSLAGAAGTFGFAEISARASALEALLIEKEHEAAAEAALDALIAEIERTLQ
ncbi:Hpt domain-containing protein [Mesorhizobium sp. B292B1B]|uniref:Hpt domain-containing protein n=1 Tax=unclassified Mesorhizobium TaxID=325217 RepID=UPI00112D09C3|nr:MULTISPECIES: Hpt domain-containing protein [unclassified Mesorhizobium]MCA0010865.1 Hpt domain-containing protein [Mesorhizobium sp. B294B1A1]MCA0035941.1 Hpt domain-containing protein [Mesorhizobium sp. B292B1B]TPM49042.1 Hpt domain-containing protein [Mesorhizobium sp. B2-3-2]